MERNELKNKIEFLKSKWKKFGKVAERKARDNALLLAAGAAATLVPVNMGHNKTDSSNETGNLIERLQNTILSPEKVKIVPEKVISDDNLIEFHNKAQDSKGREIKDFVGAKAAEYKKATGADPVVYDAETCVLTFRELYEQACADFDGGKDALACGYWKVYENVERAAEVFRLYDRLRAALTAMVAAGRGLGESAAEAAG